MNDLGEITADVFTGLLFVVFAVAGIWLHFNQCRAIPSTWAHRNGYIVLQSEMCFLHLGPFFLRTSRNQQVFRISVRDGSGTFRKGWVRCGGFLLGGFSNRADAEWDKL